MTRACLLAICLAPAAFGQLSLYVRSGIVEQPLAATYAMGSTAAREPLTANFRLRNTSAAPVPVTVLVADGAGFVLGDVPPLPAVLEPQAAVDFFVVFQSGNVGTYSAVLRSDGVSVLLTATVVASLSYSVDSVPLGASPIVFGPTEQFATSTRRVRIDNFSSEALTVPGILIQGAAFRLPGASPSGTSLRPRESAGFDIQFAPTAAGPAEGTLRIGERSYVLSGQGFAIPLPEPLLTVTLDQPRSARQGSVTVRLSSPPRTAGEGTLTLEFQPLTTSAADPAITFGTGSRTVPFSVAPGDTQPLTAAFQTGTTAGTIVFTVSLGGVTRRESIVIAPAAVTLAAVQGVRSASGIELRITGFDNARAAGIVTFTFFDAAGGTVDPGPIRIDSTADFTRFFQSSDAGGNFLLRSVFPVTGDASRIAAFEAAFITPAGTTSTTRTPLP